MPAGQPFPQGRECRGAVRQTVTVARMPIVTSWRVTGRSGWPLRDAVVCWPVDSRFRRRHFRPFPRWRTGTLKTAPCASGRPAVKDSRVARAPSGLAAHDTRIVYVRQMVGLERRRPLRSGFAEWPPMDPGPGQFGRDDLCLSSDERSGPRRSLFSYRTSGPTISFLQWRQATRCWRV
jgi:hypothetical protein